MDEWQNLSIECWSVPLHDTLNLVESRLLDHRSASQTLTNIGMSVSTALQELGTFGPLSIVTSKRPATVCRSTPVGSKTFRGTSFAAEAFDAVRQ